MCKILGHDQAVVSNQSSPSRDDALFTIGRQWKLRDACVSPIERPFCFAMSNYEDPRRRHSRSKMQWSFHIESELRIPLRKIYMVLSGGALAEGTYADATFN